uniref:NADH-ubiquinone oxidoreductase chain 5 n=1 Tax=Microcondylaea bonellii TaxID=1678567 RepID=A0A513X0D8_9BIVA|nr:NADH dehydrogenase subunit 5 [Microcondylaea bonellii]
MEPMKGFLVWAGVFFFSSFVLFVFWFGSFVWDVVIFEWEFFSACGFSMSVLVLTDFLSVLFALTVCFISGCVFVFSVSYMEGDKFGGVFSTLVAAFVAAMNILIFMPNLVFVLLGWDLLGIISFLLVVYYQNSVSVGAGMLTVLLNRIGDVFLVLSIGLSSSAGVWGILGVEQFTSYVTVVGILLVGASMTKSAQIPFSVWLPAAMAAPTPVSALVHSSTLVTVGVYFLFRHYPLLMCVEGLFPVLSKLGCLTLLMGSLGACFEFDIKKLVALSTLSHLGFMVYILSIGYPFLSVFHLLSHALFKSLLFLCAGYYIHIAGSSQDLRQMSGIVWGSSPILVACSLVGLSSLCGVPYLSGFYSKDAILEGSISSVGGVLEVLCLVIGASASCFYSMRFLLYSSFGPLGGFPLSGDFSGGWFVGVPTVLLSLGSIIFSCFMQQAWVGTCEVFNLSFFTKVSLFLVLNLGTIVLVSGSFSNGFGGFVFGVGLSRWVKGLSVILSSMWGFRWCFSSVSGVWFKYGVLAVTSLEMGWMEVIGGQSTGNVLVSAGAKLLIFEGISVLFVLRLTGAFLLALVVLFV